MAQPPGKRRDPRALGSALDELLGARKLGGSKKRNDALKRCWLEVAGEELGSHTRVTSLRREILTIEVDSAPLCHELAGFRKHELLGALRQTEMPGEIKDIRFRLGSLT